MRMLLGMKMRIRLTSALDRISTLITAIHIVIEVDKAALTGGGDIVSVWGATRQQL